MPFYSKILKLKDRLMQPLPGRDSQFRMAPTYRHSLLETGSKIKAAVMILLYVNQHELYFPLIKRPVYEGAHSGQISFPGGKTDIHDKSMIDTALRECEEEIGIHKNSIEVLGELTKLYIPVSKFEVYPVVGFLPLTTSFIPQASEVETVIEVPLSMILSAQTLETKTIKYKGADESIPFFNIYNHMVWGATAMILSEFIHIWKETE
jgi:8-oxo-dGTP pyrophosphatase MutT (NUDIX family)